MITTDELKVQLAEYHTAVKDLEEALAIDASRKRVQELEHTMSRPGFYDDAELSKKVFDEVGDLKGKLTRFEKLQGLYDDAETMLVMLDEEYDPEMVPEAEEAVNAVGKAVDELQLMTMLNGEYDHSNAILTFHAGTGGTEAQDWAEMLYRMYNKWAAAHGMSVEVLDYQDGDEAGMKSASMMVKGANAYGLLKSENGVHRLVRVSPFDANARRQTSFASLEVMPELELVPAAAETAEKPDAVVGAIEQDILTQFDAPAQEEAKPEAPAAADEPTIKFPPVNGSAVPNEFSFDLGELKFGRNYKGKE